MKRTELRGEFYSAKIIQQRMAKHGKTWLRHKQEEIYC